MARIGIRAKAEPGSVCYSLKRDLLLFDKLIIAPDGMLVGPPHFEKLRSKFKSNRVRNFLEKYDLKMEEYEFLLSKGLVELIETPQIPVLDKNNVHYKAYEQFMEYDMKLRKIWFAPINTTEPYDRQKRGLSMSNDYITRLVWINYLLKGDNNYIPIYEYTSSNFVTINNAAKSTIYEVILKEMPVPAKDTSWEQIFLFRSDPDVKVKYYRLIDWINNVAKMDLKLDDFEDRYNHLYSEYLHEFKKYKMRHHRSWVRVILVGTGAMIDNVARFKFEKIATTVCDFLERRSDLLDFEKGIEGRELAYIHAVESAFK